MKALLALFLTVFPLAAQFSNLATDDTGSRVRFSSALRLRGTQQSQFRKIFMADALSNVRLVAQVTSGDSYAILIDPEVSGDASVLVYTAYYDCSPAQSHCGVVDYTNGVISTANGTLTLPGNFHLSRNGRYVARENYAYFGPTGQFEIIDLTSLKKRSVPVDNLQEIIGGGRQVTSQGAVLAFTDVLWLFQPDGTAQLVPSAFPTPPRYSSASARAAVDDSGTNIVYQQTGTPCAIDLTGASDSVLPTTLVQSDQPCVMQTLSADGTTVLFISSANFDGSNAAGLPECWLVDTASKAIRSIGHDLAGIAEATLSGDGNVVWMVTMAGRLMRIERSTGVAQEVISRTAIVDQPNPFFHFPMTAAPGALVHLTGRGLAAQSAISTLPLATTVGGVQLLADGQPLPLLSVAPAGIVFQVPWDMKGTHTLTLAPTQSPFEEMFSRILEIHPSVPEFWWTIIGSPVIAHQDFHGLVTATDPAHPDEILHLYLTGLGGVTPAVRTGEAAPLAPLSVMTGPVYVFWEGELPIYFRTSAKVLFAGLAPGLVGLEQIEVQVPHVAPQQLGVLVYSSSGATGASFPVAP